MKLHLALAAALAAPEAAALRATKKAAARSESAIEASHETHRALLTAEQRKLTFCADESCGCANTTAVAWHPNYNTPWTEGGCVEVADCWSPEYSSELECCNGAYAGQTSGACLGGLPAPPTQSPSSEFADVWYPDYATAWSAAGCINVNPVPSGRPTYGSQLDCCKAAYAGQVSGACFSMLPPGEAPTGAPTDEIGAGKWWPDYDTAWSVAGCKTGPPVGFNDGDRPKYESELDCCQAAYRGQTSGACLGSLPAPPTGAPSTEVDFWWPDYSMAWSEGECKTGPPVGFNRGDRPEYDSELECCSAAYGGQTSGACLGSLPNAPTGAPSTEVATTFYPDYTKAWTMGVCIGDRPIPSGRPQYASKEECCGGAYVGQGNQWGSNTCMCEIDVCYSCKCAGDQSGCSGFTVDHPADACP